MDIVGPFMTVQDVADHLRVKPKTVYAWASEGRIPAVKLNGLLRFRRDEIDAWTKSCEKPALRLTTLPQERRSRGGTGRGIPPAGGIERIIDRARREVLGKQAALSSPAGVVYTSAGEARPAVKPGKEGDDGAL